MYEQRTRYFEEAQIVALTLAVVATNAWNRLVTSFRVAVGTRISRRRTRFTVKGHEDAQTVR